MMKFKLLNLTDEKYNNIILVSTLLKLVLVWKLM